VGVRFFAAAFFYLHRGIKTMPPAVSGASTASPEELVYLKPGAKIEPLICRWVAWAHLISPGTHAMNLAFRHLPHLKSFVANPTIHAAAARDPAMLGGPFVALDECHVPEVRELMRDTTERCQALIDFAHAYRELNEKLQLRAKGASLDEFFEDLPAPLAGTVELLYDLNNHPKVKIFEELLFSRLRPPGIQEICLHTAPDNNRPFFMSTPMIAAAERVFLKMTYDDPRLTTLAASRTSGACLSDLMLSLQVEEGQRAAFERCFTPEQPQRVAPHYLGDDVRLRYFGHACVLVQTRAVSVLIDPLTAWERDAEQATLTFSDLPDFIDYIVLTHAHQDHMVPEMLLQLRDRVGCIVVPRNDPGNLADPSMKLILRRLGYSNIVQLDAFESLAVPDGEIVSLPFLGEHAGLDIMSKHCVAVCVKGRKMLFMVDSDCVDPMLCRRIAERLHKVDALFIGMECHGAPLSWLYGPLCAKAISKRDDDSRRLSAADCERAWRIVSQLDCSSVFVYAMGQEPWLKHIMGLAYEPGSVQLVESERFIERCRGAGISAARLSGCREWEI
jgi:L-ascorbate metabolism protein UlaG (beta-lactamase superfamily)